MRRTQRCCVALPRRRHPVLLVLISTLLHPTTPHICAPAKQYGPAAPYEHSDPEVVKLVKENAHAFRKNSSKPFIFDLKPKGIQQRIFTLTQLKRRVLDRGVPGAVLELGCNEGRSSLRIQQLLDRYDSSDPSRRREFHVYDSFAGFPPTTEEDDKGAAAKTKFKTFSEGRYAVPQKKLLSNFRKAGVREPYGVHKGFFGNISDDEYPSPVAFALFDSDIFPSILDSFKKVWHKMSPGGVILVHDYGPNVPMTPGPERAVDAFLADKPERVSECYDVLGLIVKS